MKLTKIESYEIQAFAFRVIADAGYTWTPEMRAAYEKGKK